ncbi:MAG: hypothetical protein ACR2KE_10565 [Candidatus Nanopelagicales bacterium]
MRISTRVIAIAATVAAALLVGAVPASAAQIINWQSEPTYTPLEALGLFVGIPAAVFAVVILAVYAPGWSRKGEQSAGESSTAVWQTSPAGSMAAPSGPGIITPSGPTDHTERGGASAQW